MECPRCSHRLSLAESLTIHNPLDFDCQACVARLEVGPRGKLLMLASAMGGTLVGKGAVAMWLSSGLARNDFLLAFLAMLMTLMVVWLRLAFSLCDLRERDA